MAFAFPQQNLRVLELMPGMKVADFGAGSGAYALMMAEVVGETGVVYAVEIQKNLLSRLEAEARARHLHNLQYIWSDLENVSSVKIPPQSLDLVLISNLLFQLTGAYPAALAAKQVLKPGGRLAVIEWSDSFGGLGPAADKVVPRASAEQIFAEVGFKLERDFPAGDHHYGLIFKLMS